MFHLKQKNNPMTQRMVVVCPDCKNETEFDRVYPPLACRHCDTLFPDALDLHYHADERIIYHKDEDVFA